MNNVFPLGYCNKKNQKSQVNQSINIRLIKVVRRNFKQLKYWQCAHSIK